MTVAAILRQKGRDVAGVSPRAPIADVAHVLADRRIGAVLVLDPERRPLGILSERDIVRAIATHGAQALDMFAEQVMTRSVVTATPATTVHEAMEVMTKGRFRHLPVLEDDKLVGIVSIGDIVKARIDQQAHEVDSLRAYVAGAA